MERAGSDLTAFGETVVFLDYFKDLPDPRQAGKVIYPLPEVLLLCCWRCWRGRRHSSTLRGLGKRRSRCCAGFGRFAWDAA